MPMPEFVGYSQSVLDAQGKRAQIDNTLTNMALRQQMAPGELGLQQAQIGNQNAQAAYHQAQAAALPTELQRKAEVDAERARANQAKEALAAQQQHYAEQFALMKDMAAQRRDDVMLKGIESREKAANQRFEAMMRQIDASATRSQAPSMTEIVDPTDPTKMIRIDARQYKGGSVGSPGVIGVSGKEPTAAKKEEMVGQGRETVSSLISGLSDYYNQLDQSGGIANPDSGAISNLAAGVRSSALGQATGRAFGTQDQSVRNSIAQQRPLLLQAIRQATGMSAKAMDSNVELKLYLQAATDPTLDVKANKAALAKLDELYGTGKMAGGAQVPAKSQTGKIKFLGFEK